MQKLVSYIADDGTEFDAEEECLEYEAATKATKGIIFLDGAMKALNEDLGVAAERAEYLKILDPVAAAKTIDAICNYYGYCCYESIPTSCLNAGDVWVYDGCDDFYNLNSKITDLTDLLSRIESVCHETEV